MLTEIEDGDSNNKEVFLLKDAKNTSTNKPRVKRLSQEVDIQAIMHLGDTQESSSKEPKNI